MQRTRIKVCGLTQMQDAVIAADLGVDAIGLNFLAGPRRVSAEQARQIYRALRDRDKEAQRRPQIVALCAADGARFPDATRWDALASVFPYPVDAYQLYVAAYDSMPAGTILEGRWWLVAGVSSRVSVRELAENVAALAAPPAAVVLDAAVKGQLGGTGRTFDWTWIAAARAAGELAALPPIVLAGGLTPENVGEAIRVVRPWAVDVSSGVESGRPGVKDRGRMRAFVDAVRAADEAG